MAGRTVDQYQRRLALADVVVRQNDTITHELRHTPEFPPPAVGIKAAARARPGVALAASLSRYGTCSYAAVISCGSSPPAGRGWRLAPVRVAAMMPMVERPTATQIAGSNPWMKASAVW